MTKGGLIGGMMTALAALSLALVPAIGPALGATTTQPAKAKRKPGTVSFAAGGFTPATADPRLAAAFAGRSVSGGSFRFTPSSSGSRRKPVQVAVRARAATPAAARRAELPTVAVSQLAPTAYDLGVAVGWKHFALSGDIAKIDGGLLPGDRESARLGVSYSGKRFTARVQAGAERNEDERLKLVTQDRAYSLDIGGSYSIARNFDLTGGVRYRIQQERPEAFADDRRDSQAVYIGTAFKF
jgi:hypothetical protein